MGNLSLIDWAIMAIAVIALRFVSLSTRHYMRGVADFLSANRSAGRYLLTIASQMGGIGVVTFVAGFEALQKAGLTPNWWGMMTIPVGIVILLTGYVFYRFRETRALTMAQFMEMRYNRKFRIYAGILCSTSGVLNFGIFPAVAARFFVYYCGLPDHFHMLGLPIEFNTFATVMAIDLGLALSFVTMGGQISVMITECVQGMFCTIAFAVVAVAVLWNFKWPQMVKALELSSTPTASLINPFHTSGTVDFNIWYYLIGVVGAFYSYQSWQGTSGFYSSARTPHEQKMGGIIGVWRGISQTLAIMLVGLAGMVVLKLPEFSAQAAAVQHGLDTIKNTDIQNQMRIPMAMAHVLPIGIKGIFATIMLFISFTCHDTYMHSWGSIIIQDVIMPIRNRPLSPEQHIKWLRWSIIGVAVFSFFFSLYYPPSMPIYMFFAMTGTIWLGGSGAVIIGGLYWKKATTAAAYVALTVGAVLGLSALILTYPGLWKHFYGHDFPVNGQWLWLIGMVIASLCYVVVSLMTGGGEEFNLERMLCRGKYAKACEPLPEEPKKSTWLKIVGITPEFSAGDKALAILLVVWNAINFLWFAVFSVLNLKYRISDNAWATYWHVTVIINLVMCLPTMVWFTVGGVIDIKALFHTLENMVRDHTDDGRVVHTAEDHLPAHTEEPAKVDAEV